ncbi:MAG: hypothetical protein JO053_08710 [Acidobacteria bacterium]|nr:hypothetical protein [Acidobacteriota bacterium]
MNRNVLLTITSVLSVLLFTFHLTDDIIHGAEPGSLSDLIGATAISVVLLYVALTLTGRLTGYIILLLGGLMSFGGAAIHMTGAGVGAKYAQATGGYFFIWTLLALGTTGILSAVLAAQGLWGVLRKHSDKG